MQRFTIGVSVDKLLLFKISIQLAGTYVVVRKVRVYVGC